MGHSLLAKIKINTGELILVDVEDYNKIIKYNWHLAHGYPRTSINNKKVMLHHLILKKKKGMEVDHINRNKLDNRKKNLRLVTHLENCQNRVQIKNGTIWREKGRNFWRASIITNKRSRHIGVFKTKKEAIIAYKKEKTKILENIFRLAMRKYKPLKSSKP